MSAVAAAVIGSAIIGGVVASSSAKKASTAQVAAADKTVEEQRIARDELNRLLAPYTAAGIPALQSQMNLLGLGQKTTDWAAYARSNPAIMKAFEAQRNPPPPMNLGGGQYLDFGRIPNIGGLGGFNGGFIGDFINPVNGVGNIGADFMGTGQFGDRGYSASDVIQPYDQSMRQYDESMPQYDQAIQQYTQAMPQYDQAIQQYTQAMPQYDQYTPQYGQPQTGAVPGIQSLEEFAQKYYQDTGMNAGDDLGQFTFDPQKEAIAQLEGSAAFQALARQGEEGILQNASATGGLRGGNVQGALAQFRPALLNQFIEQQYNRLGGLTKIGQASAAGVGAAGQEAATNIGTALTASGQAQAGNALAQGTAFNTALGTITGFGTSAAGQKAFGKLF